MKLLPLKLRKDRTKSANNKISSTKNNTEKESKELLSAI